MLCEIKIENVAVIEKAAAVFSDGLNVLSVKRARANPS